MRNKPLKCTEVGTFVNEVKSILEITKNVSEMSKHPYKINFDIRTSESRTLNYWKQANLVNNGNIISEYEDKNPGYIHRDSGERFDEDYKSDIISNFRDYVIESLEERGVISKPGGLELI